MAGSLTGCKSKPTMPGGAVLPPTLQPAVPQKPSLFNPNSTTPQATPTPIDPTITFKKNVTKEDWTPDSMVAIADLRVQVALTEERPPADRQQILDSARQAYQSALKKEPKHKGAMLGLARLYGGIGEINRADEMYKQYLALNPKDHAVMHQAAMGHARIEDFAGAATWCQQALKADPENRTYRKTLGACLARAGRWDEGFAILCEVLPEAEARFMMAKVLSTMKQMEMSKQQLELAIQADPNFIPAREYMAEVQNAALAPRAVEAPNAVQTVGYKP